MLAATAGRGAGCVAHVAEQVAPAGHDEIRVLLTVDLLEQDLQTIAAVKEKEPGHASLQRPLRPLIGQVGIAQPEVQDYETQTVRRVGVAYLRERQHGRPARQHVVVDHRGKIGARIGDVTLCERLSSLPADGPSGTPRATARH